MNNDADQIIKEGVYVSRHGKLKVFHVNPALNLWIVDQGQMVSHKIFRIRYSVVHECSIGYPLFEDILKNCEYLGEL